MWGLVGLRVGLPGRAVLNGDYRVNSNYLGCDVERLADPRYRNK